MDNCKCTKEGELATLKAENKTIFKEIEGLKNIQSTILELTNNITRLVEQMRETKEDVKSIKEDIEKIKSIPTSNYQYYIRLIVGAIIGGIVGFVVKGWF